MVRLVVKATLSGSTLPRRTSFPDAFALEHQDVALKVARCFSLQPGSFRLAYRDDDNDLIELVSTSDLREALDYFSSEAGTSSSAASSSSGWFGSSSTTQQPVEPECITLKLDLVVEYDGPALSETGSSVYSLGSRGRSRRGSSSTGSEDRCGWNAYNGGGVGPVARGRRAPSTDGASDADSDRWILRTAYNGSRPALGAGPTEQDPGSESGDDDNDDDDWDRRTVSSASQPFGPPRRRQARDLPDAQRIPPALEKRHDGLYPNFARGHFTPANPHPYALHPDDRGAAHPPNPAYAHLHHPYPPPGFYTPPPPPPHGPHGYPSLFPPAPFGHAPPPPPPPGFFARFPAPAWTWGPGSSVPSLGSSPAGPSPTPSQRERARDLFGSSGSEGSDARGRGRGREEDAEAGSSYTVTSSSVDGVAAGGMKGQGGGDGDGDRERDSRPSGEGEGGRETETHRCVACGGVITGARYTCAVCEAYDLCQECERLPAPPVQSTSHDESHILLKIPAAAAAGSSSASASSSVAAAVSRAASLAPPPPLPLQQRAPDEQGHDHVADYWHWWASWYHSLPPVHPHPHPPPPGSLSSWYAPAPTEPPAATSARPEASPARLGAPPAPAPPSPPSALPTPAPPAPPAPPPPPMYALAPSRPAVRALPSYALYEYANHGVACRGCSRVIPGPGAQGPVSTAEGRERGVRWLCANCPTAPTFDLCPDCEPDSHKLHDPSHAFLRITHPLRRPLPSVRALLPVLYRPTAAPAGQDPPAKVRERSRAQAQGDLMDLRSEAGSVVSGGSGLSGSGSGSSAGSARTRLGGVGAAMDERDGDVDKVVVHARVVCDSCGQRVRGTWMACCHCQGSFDLCTPCLLAGASARQAHNPAHIFVAFKRAVDFDLHDRLTRSMTRRPRGLLEVDLYA